MNQLSLYLQVIFYIFAGINHFRNERFYLKMMPDYLPWHKPIVLWSGIAEIILGIGLLFDPLRNGAAWGIILLLIAVFPANIDMISSLKFSKIPKWILWLRLPFQLILIAWAYSFTQKY
jgi:uncharacterized membrane protein